MKNTIRVATYKRVSHDDQKKFGDSIATQEQHLKEFLEAHPDMECVGVYSDEGVSANSLKKRKELQRLLKDVEVGKIDLIIFTKLDRWFRSVAKYYKIQSTLEDNNVAWQAILEDYETLTANGRFKVNIMLSVAEQERDRTSERIKDVFQYKVSQGQPISGSQPFPFIIKTANGIKKIVHNPETEAMTYDWLNHLKTYNSIRASAIYINEKYNKAFDYITISKLAKNTMLYGSYRGHKDYCDGYMTKQEFDDLQDALKKNVRVRKSAHVHLFSRMIKCPCCGSNLIGFTSSYSSRVTGVKTTKNILRCENRYRTNKANNRCEFKKSLYEVKFEEYLLDNLDKYINDYITSLDVKEEKKKTVDVEKQKKKIKEEMKRLNIMFQKNRISLEQYDSMYEELENKLKELDNTTVKKDVSSLKNLINSNYKETYKQATKVDKKAFWNAIIKEIHVDNDGKITDIIFW